MAEVKYFRVVGRWRGYTKDDRTDIDEDPQAKGVTGGVLINAYTTRRRTVIKAANLNPPMLINLWSMDVKLDDGRLKVYGDSEDPDYDQPDVRLVAVCPALDFDDGEELIYTFTPHDVTANGQRQSLPKFSIQAPYIPENYDEDLEGEVEIDWTTSPWLEDIASRVASSSPAMPGARGRGLSDVRVDGNGELVFELVDGSDLDPVAVPELSDTLDASSAASIAYMLTFG